MVTNAEQFKNEINPFLVRACKILIDMGGLRFIDSSGIGALFVLIKKIRALGGALKICSLTDQVQSILEMVRVTELLEIFNTREDALRSFEKQNEVNG